VQALGWSQRRIPESLLPGRALRHQKDWVLIQTLGFAEPASNPVALVWTRQTSLGRLRLAPECLQTFVTLERVLKSRYQTLEELLADHQSNPSCCRKKMQASAYQQELGREFGQRKILQLLIQELERFERERERRRSHQAWIQRWLPQSDYLLEQVSIQRGCCSTMQALVPACFQRKMQVLVARQRKWHQTLVRVCHSCCHLRHRGVVCSDRRSLRYEYFLVAQQV
jgi:hypothetical protein